MNKLRLLESLIGGEKPGERLTPNSIFTSFYLITDKYQKISFYFYETEHFNNLCAIELNETIILGTKMIDAKSYTIDLDEDYPYFDSMIFQQVVHQAPDDRSLYWYHIQFLQLVYKGEIYKMGELKSPEKKIDEKNLINHYLEPIYHSTPFYISGLGIHNDGILAFQIISFTPHFGKNPLASLRSRDIPPPLPETILGKIQHYTSSFCTYSIRIVNKCLSFNPVCCLEMIGNWFICQMGPPEEYEKMPIDDYADLFTYGQGKSSILEVHMESSIPRMDMNMQWMKYRLIGCEEKRPMEIFYALYERARVWTYERDLLSRYYPSILSLIEEAVIEKELGYIHSVYRMDRYLRGLVHKMLNQEMAPSGDSLFHHDLGLTIKIYRIWDRITRTMEVCQKIHKSQVDLNCYQIAFLSDKREDILYASITIITQISLIVLLALSLLQNSFTSEIFPLTEGQIIIPIIFIFTIMVVSKQISNTSDFHEVFPEARRTRMGRFDLVSNVFFAIFIILINFFIIAYSDSLMDIVLNSLAALFILELDDSIVFISDDTKQDLYRQYLINHLNEGFCQIPDIYFAKTSWNHGHHGFGYNPNHIEINPEDITLESCSPVSSSHLSIDL